MSGLGIAFAVGAISWIIAKIASYSEERGAAVIFYSCALIFFASLIAGIILIGMRI